MREKCLAVPLSAKKITQWCRAKYLVFSQIGFLFRLNILLFRIASVSFIKLNVLDALTDVVRSLTLIWNCYLTSMLLFIIYNYACITFICYILHDLTFCFLIQYLLAIHLHHVFSKILAKLFMIYVSIYYVIHINFEKYFACYTKIGSDVSIFLFIF